MRKKIKCFSIAVLLILLISTLSFATTDNTALISTNNSVTNETTSDESVRTDINASLSDLENEIDFSELVENVEENGNTSIENDIDEYDYIDEDYFLINDNIKVEKDINGNVYLIGDKVDITSNEIAGNVFVIADEVNISSVVYMSLFVIADDINIKSGEIVDLYLMGNTVNISDEVFIDRNAKIVCDTLNMDGIIYNDLFSVSNNIKINGTVNGKLTYSGNLIEGENSVIIEKEKKEIETNYNFEESINNVINAIKNVFLVWKIITGIIIILIVFLLLKKHIKVENTIDGDKKAFFINKKFNGDDLMTLLKGLVYVILCFIIIIILCITVIGIPAGLFLLLFYILTFYISKPIACIEISKLFKIKTNSEGKSKVLLLLISIVLYILIMLLTKVQYVGFVLLPILSLYGFGTIVNMLFFKKCQKENDKTIILEKNDIVNDNITNNMIEEANKNENNVTTNDRDNAENGDNNE